MKILAWDEHLPQNYQDVSRERVRWITRQEDPDLFTVLEGVKPQEYATKGSFRIKKVDMHTIEIENRHQAFGNSKLTIEASGWELAAILNAMIPQWDNKLQERLKKQIARAIGFELAGLYDSLILEKTEYTRKVHWTKKDKE